MPTRHIPKALSLPDWLFTSNQLQFLARMMISKGKEGRKARCNEVQRKGSSLVLHRKEQNKDKS